MNGKYSPIKRLEMIRNNYSELLNSALQAFHNLERHLPRSTHSTALNNLSFLHKGETYFYHIKSNVITIVDAHRTYLTQGEIE